MLQAVMASNNKQNRNIKLLAALLRPAEKLLETFLLISDTDFCVIIYFYLCFKVINNIKHCLPQCACLDVKNAEYALVFSLYIFIYDINKDVATPL